MKPPLFLLFLSALGCTTATEDSSPPAVVIDPMAGVEPLPAPRLLRRISLDLRGTLPSIEELDAVEADPAKVGDYAAEYLASPTFEDRLASQLAERWHTVLDTYEVNSNDYRLPQDQSDWFAHSVGEEPLRLIAHVVADNRPWSEVVTADYTMSNELLGMVWPLDYPAGETGWREAHYTDGRPAAGVLSTNGFYWRYITNASNKSRGRVAAISRLLLCNDILGRPIEFQRSTILDPEEAIRTAPGCVTCHSTVDPIAASMFGFWWTISYNPYEMQTYHPERERLGPELLQTEPGWYGTQTGGLVDMGWYISHDPRFQHCAAQSFAEEYWHRESTMEDYTQIDGLWADFLADQERPQGLLLAVLQTPQYTAGSFTEEATEATRDREQVERLISPNQQRMMFEDLADLEWTQMGFVGLENDITGFRTLAGGVDGYSVTSTQKVPGLTWELVNKRYSEAASQKVVARDLGVEGAELLTVSELARPGEAEFDDQLRALHWRLFAERADDAWVADIGALWTAVDADVGASKAWESVLEAMFRDPEFVSY